MPVLLGVRQVCSSSSRLSRPSSIALRCGVGRLVGLLLAAVLAALGSGLGTPALAQERTGDVLGDLLHIKRDPTTGQPILQKRWVELTEGGLDWAYCPIPVDTMGFEIPFADLSCDPDPAYADALIDVDYFGRLSAGRTQERNQRMHFDETIDGIKNAETVMLDEAGRIRLGSGCTSVGVCSSWRVIDSPLENLALYRRVLKYGHIQTDPLDVDTSSGGDPSGGTVYHPALDAADWAKFAGPVTALLPRASSGECFAGSIFAPDCAAPQALTAADFVLAGATLGGAADKTGRVTPDLVQYLNRILKIAEDTPETPSTLQTVPTLIRDVDGTIAPAPDGLPWPAGERFVDFSAATYLRSSWYTIAVYVLQSTGTAFVPTSVDLMVWLNLMNGPMSLPAANMPGFIASSSDALRTIEFIHEYAVPADLWTNPAATDTTVAAVTTPYSPLAQMVTLTAEVTSQSLTPLSGTVTFHVRTADSVAVGVSTSAPVWNGAARAQFVLPADVEAQTLTVAAMFTTTGPFASSVGTGTLTIVAGPPPPPPPLPMNGDIDADGHPDLVWQRTDGLVFTWFMDGTTLTGGAYLSTTPIDPDWQIVGTSDLTGDGKPDLLWQNQVTGQVNIFRMDGTTKLGEQAIGLAPNTPWRIVGTGDFNRDGQADILWQDVPDGTMFIWFMTSSEGVASFWSGAYVQNGSAEPIMIGADSPWRIVGAADFSGDGWADILWRDTTTGILSIWHMNGAVFLESVDPSPNNLGDINWQVRAVGDFNADGHPDLIGQNVATGALHAWFLLGPNVIGQEPLTPSRADLSWRIAGPR